MKQLTRILACLTIFAGSFLLFLVQPMIGNLMLPHFGGTASVWIVCLMTFQILLIAGYAYAHFCMGRRMPVLHIFLLMVSAAVVVPSVRLAARLADAGGGPDSVFSVMMFLIATVGLPYVLVGANATLVQALLAKDRGGYRLYAMSNVGSFVGLLGYPLVVERVLTVDDQLSAFAVGMFAYAVLLVLLLVFVRGGVEQRRERLFPDFAKRETWVWFGLSAASCFALNAITAHLCMDISPLPLLWCAILALYLATWCIAFTDYGAKVGRLLPPVVIVLVSLAMGRLGIPVGAAYFSELQIGLALVFFGSWFVHARLYGERPPASRLTRYYFVIAVGGAFGGVLASLVAPLVFSFVAEYPVALVLLASLAVFALAADIRASGWRSRMASRFGDELKGNAAISFLSSPVGRRTAFAVFVVALSAFSLVRTTTTKSQIVCRARNFYGTIKVELFRPELRGMSRAGSCLVLENNGTEHGRQIADGDWRSARPTTYYTEMGGGLCICQHPFRKIGKPIRAAFLGMGVGTLASYGKAGDFFRFYEINPAVAKLSGEGGPFTFLKTSEAKTDVVVEDARRALELERRRGEEKYDLIVVDVFSGDSIPAHLATKEAMSLYLDRLNPEGVLAFHLSNWHLDLWPIIKAVARVFSLSHEGVINMKGDGSFEAHWLYLSRKPLSFVLNDKVQHPVDYDKIPDVRPISDAFHPLIRYVNFW